MFTMQRIVGRQLGLIFCLRNSSQAASIAAAREVSDNKKTEAETARKDFSSAGPKSE